MIEARKNCRARAWVNCRENWIAQNKNPAPKTIALGQIKFPADVPDKREQAGQQQRERVADGLLRRAAAVGVHIRQHHKTGLGIFVAIHPGNRKKMRQLPERQNGKQRPAFAAQFIARGRPAHQRRQRAGNRADERIDPGHALERRINKKVTDQRDRAQHAGQQIDRQRQINQTGHRGNAAEKHHRRRLQPAGGQRTILRAAHLGVVFAFQQLVQRRRAGRDERGCRQRVEHQQIIHRAAPAEVKTDQRRQQHERREPRLGQIRKDRRPTFFGGARGQNFCRNFFHLKFKLFAPRQ